MPGQEVRQHVRRGPVLLLVPAHSSLRGEGRASRAACVVGAGECRVCSHTLDNGPCCSLLQDAPARSAPGEGLGSHATSSQGRAQNPEDSVQAQLRLCRARPATLCSYTGACLAAFPGLGRVYFGFRVEGLGFRLTMKGGVEGMVQRHIRTSRVGHPWSEENLGTGFGVAFLPACGTKV